jgi:hypothetical protein
VSVTTPPTLDELLAAGDIQGVLRAGHERRLEREGIPMILGLADERGTIPRSTDDSALATGAALVDVVDEYTAALVPWARPDDEGAVITVLQVLAMTHFEPSATDGGAQ